MRNSVAARRRARGWLQDDLAVRAGVSRQTIVSIEKGRYEPRLALAFRLADVFGCRIEDLFTPEPSPPRSRSGTPGVDDVTQEAQLG